MPASITTEVPAYSLGSGSTRRVVIVQHANGSVHSGLQGGAGQEKKLQPFLQGQALRTVQGELGAPLGLSPSDDEKCVFSMGDTLLRHVGCKGSRLPPLLALHTFLLPFDSHMALALCCSGEHQRL